VNAAGATPGEPARSGASDRAEAMPSAHHPGARLTPLRELQLVEAGRAGDPDAVSELVQGYHRRIYAVCFRMVRDADQAADLAQEAIIKVLEGLGSYDGRSKLSTWIIRVTMNCCLSHLRKSRIRRHASLDDLSRTGDESAAASGFSRGIGGLGSRAGGPPGGELSGPDRVEQDEMLASLLHALEGLDPDMRAVLVLRDMQDMEYQQISEALEVPVGTVKSRLFRARAALREAVEKARSGVVKPGE
jgi:RNA polymerase sigma-70 factor (ECF subfamily)